MNKRQSLFPVNDKLLMSHPVFELIDYYKGTDDNIYSTSQKSRIQPKLEDECIHLLRVFVMQREI